MDPMPQETYEEIWEKDEKWPEGPAILTDLIRSFKGKHIEVNCNEANEANFNLPFEREKVSDNEYQVKIISKIPPRLHQLFAERCQLILDERKEAISAILSRVQYQRLTVQMMYQMDYDLNELEYTEASLGNPSLMDIAASKFGVPRYVR